MKVIQKINEFLFGTCVECRFCKDDLNTFMQANKELAMENAKLSHQRDQLLKDLASSQEKLEYFKRWHVNQMPKKPGRPRKQ